MRSPLVLLTGVGLVLALACGGEPGSADFHTPLLSELSPDADAALDLVDRSAALADALDAAQAPPGMPPDLDAAPDAIAMIVDSRGMDSTSGLTSGSYEAPPPGSQLNVGHAAAMVAIADANTAVIIGVPAAAAAIARNGVTAQIADNVWASTNSVSDGTTTVTGRFVVAWVGVGWLAEMRLWSSDGRYDNTLWYNGFLSKDGGFGWWDLYDEWGTLAGVIEWLGDGQGNAELGLAATSGDAAGDVLLYLFTDGTGFVGYHDESDAHDYYVFADVDRTGELLDPAWNGGAPACWDAAGYDVACPD